VAMHLTTVGPGITVTVTDSLFQIVNTSYRKTHALPLSCPVPRDRHAADSGSDRDRLSLSYAGRLFRAAYTKYCLSPAGPPRHVMESGGIPDDMVPNN
jgi:hypothetical protein